MFRKNDPQDTPLQPEHCIALNAISYCASQLPIVKDAIPHTDTPSSSVIEKRMTNAHDSGSSTPSGTSQSTLSNPKHQTICSDSSFKGREISATLYPYREPAWIKKVHHRYISNSPDKHLPLKLITDRQRD